MKSLILILTVIAVATAAQRRVGLKFRNMYKKPLNDIDVVSPKPRIIGGQEAKPNSIPYQAFLEIHNGTYAWHCGGSLISENYVLTAAHCGTYAKKAIIILGAHKISEPEPTQLVVTSDEFIIHEKFYAPRLVNDICAIKLPKPVILTRAIQLVALPMLFNYNNTYENSIARASGWGYTTSTAEEISDVLNYVDLTVINNRQCEKTFGFLMPSILCTSGASNTGSCSGDSGGPLVVNGVQIGIVSFTVLGCGPGRPSGFTRITRFLDWIEDNTDVTIM